MANEPDFEKTDLHTITRQQVYNFLLSITKSEWERDAANDFRSAQLLVAEQGGFQLIEGLQEPGVSLAFVTPCFTNQEKYNRAKNRSLCGLHIWYKQTRIRAVLGAHQVRLSICTVVLPSFSIGTRGLHEKGKSGRRLTQWFAELRNAGLKPNTVHIDKDFAEVTAASIAFRTDNSGYNHQLCLWHSLRAIDQHITGKVKGGGVDSSKAEVLLQLIRLKDLREGQLSHRICTFCLKSLNGYFQRDRQKSAVQIRRESFVT
ncbi:hypothetical protein LIPSTDRAFT_211770 [Lipomyces starkeyi NRRL Y-11557]|uniref:MULE transposase domain-containing protein n=1 Tax=Lipomyces starkeyi NRRL Y-11557 TaxID=675824 RepID=A0A1E3QD53_LIPST|nr:hypothetical protein LIPSTDRAFT_211770 [Lipomyces starkeyi NRRL Y-11557]